MIKVNLLKNRSMQGGGDTTYAVSIDRGGNEAQKEAVIKIMLMAVFAVVLVFVENHNVDSLKEEQQRYMIQLNELQAEVDKLKAENSKVSELEKQSKELEDKMKIMKQLSKTRLRELKALDYMQTIMPERVWLTTLTYQDEKFSLKGFALTDDDLTDLIQALDKSVFFTDVILLQAKEQNTPDGTLKNFEITTAIGVAE
ncbi:MAG: PilN domain-containing protein [Bdellovibrionaceae bacterium]|nr:PilN domain-containing protein [Bdellovibrionales bacterium]MCB9086096.1 PilN domain-containing protein [Pseudobdellovibrionaceae bacterium]